MIVHEVNELKKELTYFFDVIRKKDMDWYGPKNVEEITGKKWENVVNVVFDRVFKSSKNYKYISLTKNNLCFDGIVVSIKSGKAEMVSYKGSKVKYAKTLHKNACTITQCRTTRHKKIKDKKGHINETISQTDYELVCFRKYDDKDEDYKFKVILFKKKIFSIPHNAKFIKKHVTKNRKSGQSYFKYNANPNVCFTITGSTSDQLMIHINNLEKFIKQSKSKVLYNSF